MSKRFAIIEENLVVNVVLADDDSLAKENETWVDITEYISHIPAIGWSYTNNKFCKSPSALALREDSVTYKIKTSPLLENQTLSFGDWIYQGNSYDKFVFSGFVKSYDANTRFLLYYDKEGSINPNVAISTVNFDFTLGE